MHLGCLLASHAMASLHNDDDPVSGIHHGTIASTSAERHAPPHFPPVRILLAMLPLSIAPTNKL